MNVKHSHDAPMDVNVNINAKEGQRYEARRMDRVRSYRARAPKPDFDDFLPFSAISPLFSLTDRMNSTVSFFIISLFFYLSLPSTSFCGHLLVSTRLLACSFALKAPTRWSKLAFRSARLLA